MKTSAVEKPTVAIIHPSQDDLTYSNIDDAGSKISSVLASPTRQEMLRDHLRHRSELFSTDVYMEEIAQTVRIFLSSSPSNI